MMTQKLPPVIRDICGEYRGWNAHQKNGEDKCAPCQKANRDYVRALRHRKGESKASLYTPAQIEEIKQQAASDALRKMHTIHLTRRASRIKNGSAR